MAISYYRFLAQGRKNYAWNRRSKKDIVNTLYLDSFIESFNRNHPDSLPQQLHADQKFAYRIEARADSGYPLPLVPRLWPQLTFTLPLERVTDFFSRENEPIRNRFGYRRSLYDYYSASRRRIPKIMVESAAASIGRRLTQAIEKGPGQTRKARKLSGFLTMLSYIVMSQLLDDMDRLAIGSTTAPFSSVEGEHLRRDSMRFYPKVNMSGLGKYSLSQQDRSWLYANVKPVDFAKVSFDAVRQLGIGKRGASEIQNHHLQTAQRFVDVVLSQTEANYTEFVRHDLIRQESKEMHRGKSPYEEPWNALMPAFEWRAFSNPYSIDNAFTHIGDIKRRLQQVIPLLQNAFHRSTLHKSLV